MVAWCGWRARAAGSSRTSLAWPPSKHTSASGNIGYHDKLPVTREAQAMKCPFCAEDDLKDEATVCKHCGRDVGVYRSFAARIAVLEQRVSDLNEALAVPRLRPDEAIGGTQRLEKRTASPTQLSIAVVVAAVTTALLNSYG